LISTGIVSDGPFTIGWIGTPRNEPYLKLITEPLRHLHDVYGARLRVIGGGGDFSLPGVAIDHIPWREDSETRELAPCHVDIMPLLDGGLGARQVRLQADPIHGRRPPHGGVCRGRRQL
jgi:hypothetical protein